MTETPCQVDSDDVEGTNLTCTDCSLKALQFKASSPFYSNDDIKNVYSSLTSSCSATGYSLSTSTFTFTAPSTTATSVPTGCNGTEYTISPGDTCLSVPQSQSIGTTWLLLDNDLAAYCGNFPSNGTLCIAHQCTTYTVQQNDTCTAIASANNITYAQILAWNPNFDLLCSNINKSVNTEICLSSPPGTYIVPDGNSTSAAATSATTAAPIPTDVAEGSVANCGEWYEVEVGDYCNQLTPRFRISLDDFLVLNPELNEKYV